MARYIVEFCKFSDGTWYEKTKTDFYAAASSVANCSGYGRIGKVTDTETGRVRLYNTNVDWDKYEEHSVDVDCFR